MTRSRAGFTLVEALIALSMFALIAAAGAAVLRQAIDNKVAVRAASARVGDLQRVRGQLKADLGQAAARRTRAATGRPSSQAMTGALAPGDPLLVVVRAGASNPGGRSRPSLQRVEYRVVDGRLERRAASHLDGSRPGPPQILYRGVRDARVAFLRDGAEAPAFLATSDAPLPDAVRIVMTLDGYGPLDQLFAVGGGR